MNLKTFWYAALERAVKTGAQVLLMLWVSDAGFDITNVNLQHSLELAGGAALLSLVTSMASAGVNNNGPSLATEALTPTAPPG